MVLKLIACSIARENYAFHIQESLQKAICVENCNQNPMRTLKIVVLNN